MKKVLFIDRDGTLIEEPKPDLQVDSLEKLVFMPKVFQALAAIVQKLEYELVMVTNQDGLGTPAFPEATFWPAHQKMLTAFENEGIFFDEILIDRSLPEQKLPTRKPGTALLRKYLNGHYDIQNSWVIGDRSTDVELAQNLGTKAILIGAEQNEAATLQVENWGQIAEFLTKTHRKASLSRITNETAIDIRLNLDGSGLSQISTGMGFFDHMLTQIAKHGGIDLFLIAKGDLFIDEHHTVEDVGICLGRAVKEALGKKYGIQRYGFLLPMDESLAQVALDFGGRPYFQWEAVFKREKVGEMATELFPHFFESFAHAATANLHIKSEGRNEHHKIEGIFKAFAKTLKKAIARSGTEDLPSSKGSL